VKFVILPKEINLNVDSSVKLYDAEYLRLYKTRKKILEHIRSVGIYKPQYNSDSFFITVNFETSQDEVLFRLGLPSMFKAIPYSNDISQQLDNFINGLLTR
jgi:hypothetical protein